MHGVFKSKKRNEKYIEAVITVKPSGGSGYTEIVHRALEDLDVLYDQDNECPNSKTAR